MDFDELANFLSHQRAIRLFDTSRDVPDELVEKMLRVAICAPNGGNRQPWRFVVVREHDTKSKLGTIFDEVGRALYGDGAPTRTPWEEVPLLIAVCSVAIPNAPTSVTSPPGASAYPAVQNLLLAASALGLGSVLTTRWKMREPEIKAILGLPEGSEVHSILPVGWPDRKYGRGRRAPFTEVAYRERFGQSWEPIAAAPPQP